MYKFLNVLIILVFVMQPSFAFANKGLVSTENITENINENLNTKLDEFNRDEFEETEEVVESEVVDDEKSKTNDLSKEDQDNLKESEKVLTEKNSIKNIKKEDTDRPHFDHSSSDNKNKVGEITIQQVNVKTPIEWYDEAMSQKTASKRFEIFLEAINLFPNNEVIIKGLESSAKNLLNWASNQHLKGNFVTAIDRYNKIITIKGDNFVTDNNGNGVNSEIIEEAIWKKSYAENRKIFPNADELYKSAMSIQTASGRFDAFIKAYNEVVPKNDRLKKGIEESAQQLFNYAKKQHQNGNFSTAIDRYKTILDEPLVPQEIKETVRIYLEFAKNSKKIPSANNLYNQAVKENRASYKLDLFIEGYELYPNDSRFVKGIRDSAESLLKWAINKHHAGEFEVAINRYQSIINAPKVLSKTKNEANKKLAEAEIGKRPAGVIYDLIKKEKSASRLFDLNVEGLKFYPNDKRFINGLSSSAKSLFNLAFRYHNQENFADASARYEKLLSTEGVPNKIKTKAELLQGYANKSINPDVTYYLNEITNETTASGKLNISLEAYLLYENDQKIINSVIENARLLLNWATQRHLNGEFDTAINRYDTILNLPVMEDSLKAEVEAKRNYALNKKILPTADTLYQEANTENRASYKFNLFIEGLILFPNDNRFIEGVADSSNSLLNLARRYHKDGKYTDAISRYDTLLSYPGVPIKIYFEAELRKKYANKNEQVPSANKIRKDAENLSTVSSRFNKFLEGYILYPTDKDFANQLILISYDLYNYTYKLHRNKNYTGAVSRYETLLKSPGVPNYIKEFAKVNIEKAKSSKPPVNEIINYINYNISLKNALEQQMKASPQTDKSQYAWVHKSYIDNNRVTASSLKVRTQPSTVNSNENYVIGTLTKGTKVDIVGEQGDWYAIKFSNGRHWIHAVENDVLYYLNPNNFVNNSRQIFQFLDLSKPSGATKYDLNRYLKGKGSLENKGDAFIRAARLYGINDIYLISHALLETGNGTSDLATGKIKVGEISKNNYVVVLPGNKIYIVENGKSSRNDNFKLNGIKTKSIYNMYGIGAVDRNPLILGAVRAYNEGWFNPENAIIGGAAFIGKNYINAGQNTLYKMRWNPDAMAISGYATHQYATDIGWASKQVNRIYTMYNDVGLTIPILDIPVYK